MKRQIKYFVLAVFIESAAFFVLGWGQWGSDADAFEQRRAMTIARAVSWVAEQGDREALQRFVEPIARQVDGVRRVLLLKNVAYLAHSDPKLVGERLSRDSEEDKQLYDQANRIKADVQKNAQERERNPELGKDAYSEVRSGWIERGNLLAVALPVKQEGEFRAMVEVRLEPKADPTGLPVLFLVLALGAAALFGLAVWGLKGRSLLVPGVGLLVLLLVAQVYSLSGWRGQVRRQHWELLADTLCQLSRAGMLQASQPAEEAQGEAQHQPAIASDELIAALNFSKTGERIGDLVAIQTVPKTGGSNHDLVFESNGCRVEFDTAYQAGQRSRDVRHLALWGFGFMVLALLGYLLGVFGQLTRAGRSLTKHRSAYMYLSPAILGMLVLVFIPVTFGLVLGFMDRRYNVFEFAGLSNYFNILGDLELAKAGNFYYTLGVTVLWTGLNVMFHVTIGLFLALLLNDQVLKARGIYRVLFILPWAIPSYITALIWKGLFHKQFGAINHFLQMLGFEPISWFQSFWPAFSANFITNVWLGFPFMMMISLGALQSIPADLYEAARVDGASRWQRFSHITLPLLRPALVPAVIVGTVWTFNMFNIIYLVSGGGPNGQTDILITDAFRWAFERDKYGYAAAYSTLIFFILLAFTLVTSRITGATKSAYE